MNELVLICKNALHFSLFENTSFHVSKYFVSIFVTVVTEQIHSFITAHYKENSKMVSRYNPKTVNELCFFTWLDSF